MITNHNQVSTNPTEPKSEPNQIKTEPGFPNFSQPSRPIRALDRVLHQKLNHHQKVRFKSKPNQPIKTIEMLIQLKFVQIFHQRIHLLYQKRKLKLIQKRNQHQVQVQSKLNPHHHRRPRNHQHKHHQVNHSQMVKDSKNGLFKNYAIYYYQYMIKSTAIPKLILFTFQSIMWLMVRLLLFL